MKAAKVNTTIPVGAKDDAVSAKPIMPKSDSMLKTTVMMQVIEHTAIKRPNNKFLKFHMGLISYI